MEGVSRPEPDAGADEIGPSDDLDESDFLAYVVYPTLLALLFAMLSLPVVALSLDLTDTPDTGRWVGVLGTVLTNGKVLLTGDADSGPRAELYDPATGKFTPIAFEVAPGAAPSAQYKGQTFERTAPDTATLLKDGRVLLFEAGYLETYDPATGMFSPAGFISPPGQWNSPTATLLAKAVCFSQEVPGLQTQTHSPMSSPRQPLSMTPSTGLNSSARCPLREVAKRSLSLPTAAS